jgi:hypothetical protein
MYLFGGKINTQENSNQIFQFDFNNSKWSEIKPTFQKPPQIDSHSCDIYTRSKDEDYMIIFGGFIGGKKGLCSNTVYQYHFQSK